MKTALICAVAENNVIGDKGQIPWHIPEDFKIFKDSTSESVVIMGRRTWESLPVKPLPKRVNIVIGKKPFSFEGVPYFGSIQDALDFCSDEYPDKNVFFIGGSRIYEEALWIVDELYLSHVKGSFEGDTFFPQIDYSKWEIVEEKEFEKFTFRRYVRKV